MKKFLAVATLVTLLVSGIAGTASAARPTTAKAGAGHNAAVGRFTDLSEQHWAEADIAKMNARGVVKGYEDGTFQPNKPVTRAEVAALAVRLVNKEDDAKAETNPELSFRDLASVAIWARPYIAIAVKEGLMNGAVEEGAHVFQAHKPATRLEVAIILVRALGFEDLAKASTAPVDFADAAKIPAWAVGYIAVALEKGLVSGYPDKSFQPNKPVTRAEMAAMLSRSDDEQDDALVVNAVRGTIKSVTTTAPGSITLTVRGADQTVELVANAQIYLNKKPATLADLQAGDHGVVVKNSDGKGVYVGAKRDEEEKEEETSVAAKSLKSFTAVTLTQTGDINHNNVQYANAAAVIAALPTGITVTLGDDTTVSVPVTWADTDTYNAAVAANYTFTATWGALPAGVDNASNLAAPTVEVAVAQGTWSMTSYTPVTLTQTGTVAGNNVQYANAAAVIAALPANITVTLENASTVSVPVTWADTDTYNAAAAASYTFTATWGTLPADVDNDNSVVAPVVEVTVAP